MSQTYSLNIHASDPHFGLAGVLPLAGAMQSVLASNGVAGFATAGLPGFAPAEAGTFGVYRRISAHPTVALVMRMVTAPIVAGSWTWTKRADAPARWLTFAKAVLEPMRTQVLTDGLRALAFGFAAFEKVWQSDGNGRLVLAQLKPLLPELTQILVDRGGNFAGLKNHSPGKPPRTLGTQKSFLYTNDGECGNLYGRSRHENIRITWSQAMQTAERLAQYQKKIAGVIAQLHYPEGTSRDAAGVERSNDVIAQQILEAVSMGRSVRFPNLFASIDDPAAAADLAGKSQWVLSQFDPGGTDYSTGMLNVLANYDKLLFRGWLRPERTGLEALHASRADAEQHSESSVQDSELIDRDFAAAFNQQVVDELLMVNFGPRAHGAVRVEPAPLSDTKTTTAAAVLTTLLKSADLAANPVAQRIDVAALLAELDVPVKSNEE
jgi:hypothetical protein